MTDFESRDCKNRNLVQGPLLQHTEKSDGAIALPRRFADMLTSGSQLLTVNLSVGLLF